MPRFLFPLTAVHLHGETRILNSIADFESFERLHRITDKHIFHSAYYDAKGFVIRASFSTEWVVRDELGQIVSKDAFDQPRSKNWKKRLRNRRGDFEFRFDPVRYTGRCKQNRHSAPRKKNGGAGVRIRIKAHHSHDPRREVE
jgi:hypothetical protein